jgi:hypothetical protein
VFILKRVTEEFSDVFIAEELGSILGAKTGRRRHDFVEVFIPGDLTTDFLRVRRDERCLAGCHDCRRRDSQPISYYLTRVNKGAVLVVVSVRRRFHLTGRERWISGNVWREGRNPRVSSSETRGTRRQTHTRATRLSKLRSPSKLHYTRPKNSYVSPSPVPRICNRFLCEATCDQAAAAIPIS